MSRRNDNWLQIVGVVALWAIVGKLFRRGLTALAKRAGASTQRVRTIRDGVGIAWIVVAVAAVLIVMGIASEFQALTVTGLAGLTISLALQTTLSNIITGVLLFSDKTLRLNDVISYGGIRGTIVRVDLRSTLIRTQEGNIAIISSSTLMSGPFINYTAEERLVGKILRPARSKKRCIERLLKTLVSSIYVPSPLDRDARIARTRFLAD